MSRAFFDTNILVYAFGDDAKRHRARALLRMGGMISVQSLNEFANSTRRKHGFDWHDIRSAIVAIRTFCPDLISLDQAIHEDGLRVAERYKLSVYDGMIVAVALTAKCDILWSEDMHNGLVIDGRLRIINPFAAAFEDHPPR